MDDFNMNNKTPLNSSDQNNEQPAAETRNTAPQNEQPAQAPQSEQPMQQPQAEQPAQVPQSEQPQAEEPRTPFVGRQEITTGGGTSASIERIR